MELKAKKIVAREGLIILGILLVSVMLLLSSAWMSSSERKLSVKLEDRLKRIESIEKKIISELPLEILKSKYSDVFTISDRIEFYIKYEEIVEDLGLLILFTIYPLILVFRFIIWAVATLKK